MKIVLKISACISTLVLTLYTIIACVVALGNDTTLRPTSTVDHLASTIYVDYIPFDWITYSAVTPERMQSGLDKALSSGLDKSQASSTRRSIVAVLDADTIRSLDILLRKRLGAGQRQGEPRLLIESAKGEHKMFVDQGGDIWEANKVYKLTPEAFAQLKRLLGDIYHEKPSL